MKKYQKSKTFLSLVMVFVMMLSLGVMDVSAERLNPQKQNGTLTLTEGQAGEKTDSRYSAYKILNATSQAGQDVYEYAYTQNFSEFGKIVALKDLVKMAPGSSDYHVNTDVNSVDMAAVKLESYIKDKQIQPDVPEFAAETQQTLSLGYYLILETTFTEGYKETKPILVSIPKSNGKTANGVMDYTYDVNVQLKDQLLETTKTIEEAQDQQSQSAASQVGKTITFEVKQDIPQYYDDGNITFKVTDMMSKGLTFGKVLSVKADTSELTADTHYTYTSNKNGDGTTTLTFDFSGANYKNVKDKSKLTIRYTATLNKDADFTLTGNGNEVEATFGRDGNTITGVNPPTTKTYAGVLELTKKNEAGDTLKGAKFTVYEDAECKTPAKLVTYEVGTDGNITTTPNPDLSPTVITGSDGIAKFSGLGEGDYYIKEEQSPSGYIELDKPIHVKVEADFTPGQPVAFTYTVDGNGVEAGSIVVDDNLVTFDVVNTEGFELPTTGGMGTYVFMIGGGLLILAAVVLLIRSRKKSDDPRE